MQLKEELKKIGLTEGESKVYVSLLRLGPSTVGPLISEASVSPSKIYDVLLRLENKGLVTWVKKEKTKYFEAVQPKRLISYLEEKKMAVEGKMESLKSLLPKLENLEAKKTEEAEVYTGLRGLRSAYECLLKDANENEPLLFFYVHEEEMIKKANLFYSQLFHLFEKMKIKVQGVATQNFKDSKNFKKPPKFIDLRYVKFPLPSTVDIYEEKVLISSWGDETPTAYLLHSKKIANNYRNYFNKVWKQAKS